jgi:uncharacterized membrane protein
MIRKMTTNKALATLRSAGGKASWSVLDESEEGLLQAALACLQESILTFGSSNAL